MQDEHAVRSLFKVASGDAQAAKGGTPVALLTLRAVAAGAVLVAAALTGSVPLAVVGSGLALWGLVGWVVRARR